MCTILTIDRDFYLTHRSAVQHRIKDDFKHNPHGSSMLTMGCNENDTVLIRALDIDLILTILELRMLSGGCERVWIHQRYATTGYLGLNGCHGFAAGDYTVMHNGILQRLEADTFAVDSELLAFEVEAYGLEEAIDRCMVGETYANVFFINNKTGQYQVLRLETGSLYTDGKGNYSTHVCGPIAQPVNKSTHIKHDEHVVIPAPVPKRKYRTKGSAMHAVKDAGDNSQTASQVYGWDTWDTYDYHRWDDVFSLDDPRTHYNTYGPEDNVEWQIQCLPDIKSYTAMVDFATDEYWFDWGVPKAVYDVMSKEQQGWVHKLGIQVRRDVLKKASNS